MNEFDNCREFGWDDEIQNDGADWVVLPEGDYEYAVLSMERGRFEGSKKLPPCNSATLKLAIDGKEKGVITIEHRLFLHTKTEGLLCAFFESIGQRKHGEPLRMNWNNVIGAQGLCHLEIHTYPKKDGTEGQSNQVKRFLPPPEPKAAPAGGWTQGSF